MSDDWYSSWNDWSHWGNEFGAGKSCRDDWPHWNGPKTQ